LSFDFTVLAAIGLLIALIFLYFFSFFVSLVVYAVHRDLQTVNFDTYWNELFKSAALKIFFLYLVFSIIFYLVSSLGFAYNFVFAALVINLVLGLVIMFAPQSIVLDEVSVAEAVQRSIEFWVTHFGVCLAIFVVSFVLFAVIVWVELFFDSVNFPGIFVSFILTLVFLVPFVELAKSYAYLMRNDLLKSNEYVHARAPRTERAKPVYSTRLREKPRHGSKL
jgi:signal transduction histidine kinase